MMVKGVMLAAALPWGRVLPVADCAGSGGHGVGGGKAKEEEILASHSTTKMFRQKAVTMSRTVNFMNKMKDDDDADHPFCEVEKDSVKPSNVLHRPSGEQLLVDIKHVDPLFLNSEDRLAQALLDLIEEAKLTLASYHCYSVVPMGLSCVGLLLDSHIAFHTWPQEGAIIMDLFACGEKPLIPVLPTIKKNFAVPSTGKDHLEPKMLWSLKRRGFHQGFDPNFTPYANPIDQDLGIDLLRRHDLDMKEMLVSEETEFQHVDIIKLIDPRVRSLSSYERSLEDGTYESRHPEFYRPDTFLYLDGVHQSSLNGEAEYHEALVHAAMIAHPSPKRVAIIGGGEGATLREVLKHKTVEAVVMVEIDQELVEMCRQFIPEWSNCTDIEGSDAESCFDDSRATIVYDDAFRWFIDTFGEEVNEGEQFDVIVMDALDPERIVAVSLQRTAPACKRKLANTLLATEKIVGSLYKDNKFVDSLFKGMTKDGMFVVQLGQSVDVVDSALEEGQTKDAAHMMKALEDVGLKSMFVYDEGHSHFLAPWSILAASKDYKSRANWYRTAPEIEIELHKRLHRTKSGKPILAYFDGPTMVRFQVPPKAAETIYCRKNDTPDECRFYRGSDHSLDYHIPPSTWSVMGNLYSHWVPETGGVKVATLFAKEYGSSSNLLGKEHIYVDMASYKKNVSTDDDWVFSGAHVYSPVVERHLRQVLASSRAEKGRGGGDVIA